MVTANSIGSNGLFVAVLRFGDNQNHDLCIRKKKLLYILSIDLGIDVFVCIVMLHNIVSPLQIHVHVLYL